MNYRPDVVENRHEARVGKGPHKKSISLRRVWIFSPICSVFFSKFNELVAIYSRPMTMATVED